MELVEWKLHHIAYAVRNTDETIKKFHFAYIETEYYKVYEKSQNIYFTYISNADKSLRIELVEAGEGNSPVDKMLTEEETVLYHVCYEVNDFNEGCDMLRKQGFISASKPFVPEYNHNIKICHMYSIETGLVEILGPNMCSESSNCTSF